MYLPYLFFSVLNSACEEHLNGTKWWYGTIWYQWYQTILKYESVRIDFKAVVFIRANPGKKETTDGSDSHVNFIQKLHFSEVVSPEKLYVTNIKSCA